MESKLVWESGWESSDCACEFRPGLFGLFSGHKVNEFCKSKAALGSITAVDRSRVSELQNPEEDKPLAAHWRAL